MRLYRAVSVAEYDDLRVLNRFRPGPNSLEGKWFADSYDGVLLHADAHYPDCDWLIVAAEVPDAVLIGAFRLANLDGFGPATYLDESELGGIVPILEVNDG